MAASSSGVARPAVSSITETRYCISDHLLWFGVSLMGGLSPLLRTPLPRSDTASRMSFKTFWCAGCILRAPDRPVDLERDALREGSRFGQIKRYAWAGIGEQPRALATTTGRAAIS